MAQSDSNTNTDRFSFGKNWDNFAANALDEPRIQIATQALETLLGMDTLQGQTFLDIGCGSGLHSLSAFRLHANRIVSFDYDADSVSTTDRLRASVGAPPNWSVFQGSILDEKVVASYRANIVYSWGVLHHTGHMWQAIRNASRMVEGGGLFCIAIYNKVDRVNAWGTSAMWQKIKRAYVHSPPWRQSAMVSTYKIYWGIYSLLHMRYFGLYSILRLHKNPFAAISTRKKRGMSWHHDVIDWVGGYPFEYASVEEIRAFCENELHLQTLKILPRTGHSNNEFVFRAPM